MKNSSKVTGKKRKGKRQKIKSALTQVVQKESDYRQQKRKDKKKKKINNERDAKKRK